ncbi:hypothetical protein Sste5346_008014 [Sporothrix stenoceras]|uniref:Carotenoid cleavage dioxygenase 1 n=1 Tax=Sporothrix stenoceras TaxID=5173 RepID=A0ABR3YR77_9PEZI
MGSVPEPFPAEAAVLPAPPGYRTVDDEKADYTQALKRVNGQSFKDWPNEAGFDGLREERGPIEIPVTGTIPAYAAGSLYRTGPGVMKVEGTPKGTHYISHWFDGLAHTHRFEIVAEPKDQPNAEAGGEAKNKITVFYSSRRQSEARMRLIQEQGAAKLFSFAQRADPCIGLLGKFMSTFKAAALGRSSTRHKDSENVNVVVHLNVPGVKGTPPVGTAATKADRRSMAVFPNTATSTADDKKISFTPAPQTSSGHRAKLPDSVWITTDATLMRRVDPATLEPIGVASQDTLHPDLKGPMSSSHAQRDPVTGDFYNFNLDLGATPTYRVFRVSQATGKTDILATIRCRNGPAPAGSVSPTIGGGSSGRTPHISNAKPAYIHSFFLTARYVVLCIPCTHVAQNGLKMLWDRNVLDGLEQFNPANKTRWIVVDRQIPGRGVVGEFDSPASFFFHSVNAYEEEEDDKGSIVCDIIDYPTSDVIHALYYDVLLNRNDAATDFYNDPVRVANINPCLSRYRLTLPSSSSSSPSRSSSPPSATTPAVRDWMIAGPHAGELPSINPRYATRRHRFVYSVANQGRSTLADGLVKTDTETRAALLWDAPHGHTPGEAIFIENPDSKEDDEDDGVLLSVVLDGTAGKSYLLCLDARTMTETGRAEVGFAIGFGFHGVHARA